MIAFLVLLLTYAALITLLVLVLAVSFVQQRRQLTQLSATLTATQAQLTRQVAERAKVEAEALERHQIELEHLWHANLLGELACQLAHEITQPLSAIINYTQGCARRLAAPDSRPEALLWPLQQTVCQAELAGDILRQFRQRLQRQPTQSRRLDLNYLSCQVAVLMETSLQSHNIRLNLDLTGRLPEAWGDPLQVQQVAINLIRNSIQALRDYPVNPRTVTLNTQLNPDGSLQLRVCDNGPGLPPDLAHERLFDAFVTTHSDGLGLGLTLSRSLIKGLGGNLWAEANTLGGACFCFTLPPPNLAADPGAT